MILVKTYDLCDGLSPSHTFSCSPKQHYPFLPMPYFLLLLESGWFSWKATHPSILNCILIIHIILHYTTYQFIKVLPLGGGSRCLISHLDCNKKARIILFSVFPQTLITSHLTTLSGAYHLRSPPWLFSLVRPTKNPFYSTYIKIL